MEISCPKCGSHDLHADKKGFSGKRAAAGALLIGGVGLLAGTAGSNKIQITCLKCGHVFGPGGRLANGKRPPTAGQFKAARVIFLVVGILFALMGLPSLFFPESRGFGIIVVIMSIVCLWVSHRYANMVKASTNK